MIAAVIVFYNPSLTQERHWEFMCKQFDKAYFIYNSPKKTDFDEQQERKNIEVIQMDHNMGIAYALDYAKNLSEQGGYEWLYTFDQDSIIDQDYAERLINLEYVLNHKVAMVCPLIDDHKMRKGGSVDHAIEIVATAITSGCAIKLNNTRNLNFDSSLFIDYVDYDMCLKIINSGQKIVRNNKVKLYHSIGDHSSSLGIYTSNHNALRRYYMFRNRIYLIKRYARTNVIWALRELIRYPTEICKIILFENDKLKKIMMCGVGIFDGINGRMGIKHEQ